MRKKSAFEKKYPQFVKYITDEQTQINMLNNNDLYQRCENNSESIAFLLLELDRHFDMETIKSILFETVFKYPDKLLKTFISAYLNSDEATKSNAAVVSFFNKTIHLGTECLEYIEKCGIIANRKYKDLPIIVINYQYKKVKTGNEKFKEEMLDNLFESLSYEAKKLVVKLLENKSFEILDMIFKDFEYTLDTILEILISKGIDEKIINKKLFKNLNQKQMMILVCMLIDSDMNLLIIDHLNRLILNNRINLIITLIDKNLMGQLYRLTHEEIITKTDDEIIKELMISVMNLKKRDE